MLRSCDRCHGFLPTAETRHCPHCDATIAPSRAIAALRSAAGLGAAAVTVVSLMACYGMGYVPVRPPEPQGADADGDGFSLPNGANAPGVFDCDDTRADVHPGAEDAADDGVDENCDGVDGMAPARGAAGAPTASIAVDPTPASR